MLSLVNEFIKSIKFCFSLNGKKRKEKRKKKGIGLDMGVSSFITFSDGKKIENLIFKERIPYKTISYKEFSQYRERMYKSAFEYIKKYNPDYVCIETLDFTGDNICEDIKIKIKLLDYDLFFKRLLLVCKKNNIELRQVPKNYPSSKICSKCGNINTTLTLNDRVYKCKKCNVSINRDANAALNIKNCMKYKIL